MALTADELDAAARSVVDLYRAAEQAVLGQVTRRLRAGQDATDWQAQRLGQLSSLRGSVQRILDATEAEGGPRIRAAVADAWRTGTGRATVGLPAELLPRDPATAAAALARPALRVDVVESLAGELVSDVHQRHANVLRHVEDAYRGTIQRAAAVSAAAGQTRLAAAQHAYQRFLDQGITGFTDITGRHWRLSSYVEMGVRTVTQRAAVQGQTDRLQDLGLDLVIISDSPRECEWCRPWEGTVLSVSGSTPVGRVETDNLAGPGTVEVTIDGTLDEARRAGLFHPNCTHSARGYLPGATRRHPPDANPQGDIAQQRQRDIERQIRKWKERELGALDPAAAAGARGRARAWQRALREHLDVNPELKRLRYRERVGAGNIPPTASGIRAAPTPPPPPARLATTTLPLPARPQSPPRRLTHDEAVTMQERMLAGQPWTREQIDALAEISGAGYLEGNELLRGLIPAEDLGDQLPRIRGMIQNATAGMRPLAEPVLVSRRVDERAFGLDAIEDLPGLIGETRQEPAFMHTSMVGDLGEEVGAVLMEISVPAGTPAAYIEPITQSPEEFELMLAPGQRYHILGVELLERELARITVEIIP